MAKRNEEAKIRHKIIAIFFHFFLMILFHFSAACFHCFLWTTISYTFSVISKRLMNGDKFGRRCSPFKHYQATEEEISVEVKKPFLIHSSFSYKSKSPQLRGRSSPRRSFCTPYLKLQIAINRHHGFVFQ